LALTVLVLTLTAAALLVFLTHSPPRYCAGRCRLPRCKPRFRRSVPAQAFEIA
jgi:hypothetical protein